MSLLRFVFWKSKDRFLFFLYGCSVFSSSNTSLCILCGRRCVAFICLSFGLVPGKFPNSSAPRGEGDRAGHWGAEVVALSLPTGVLCFPRAVQTLTWLCIVLICAVQQQRCWHNCVNSRGVAGTWLNGQLLGKGVCGVALGNFLLCFPSSVKSFWRLTAQRVTYFSLVGNRQCACQEFA